MNGAIAAAERAKESRDAARAWRRAGFIDEDTLARILSLYPDDRRRFGPGFRSLAFIFTGIAVFCVVGLWYAFFDHNPGGNGSLIFWGLVLAALTEFQRGPLKRTDAGAESATALLAVSFGVVAAAIGAGGMRFEDIPLRLLGSSFPLCALAAWRWGDRLFFLGAGLSGFGLLAQLDQGRLIWILVSALLVPLCISGARNPRFSPSHRGGAVVLGAVAILALYAAVHIWSLDERAIESMRVTHAAVESSPSPFRTPSILATALLPPLLLAIGWRRREPLLLYAGLLLVGASIATIRIYREVMPLSFALILIGGACMALALGVRRWLRSGEGGERGGFTADPLFDNKNRTEAIRSVVALASFAPPAQPAAPSGAAFEGGGGGFGGGGASGTF